MARQETETTPHKYCLSCGYILDGLPSERCPECGRTFDSNVPDSFATRLRSGGTTLLVAVLGGMAFAAGMACVYLNQLEILHWGRKRGLLGILIPGGVLCCIFVAGAAYESLYGRHTAFTHRSRLKMAIAIGAAVTLWGMGHTIIQVIRYFF